MPKKWSTCNTFDSSSVLSITVDCISLSATGDLLFTNFLAYSIVIDKFHHIHFFVPSNQAPQHWDLVNDVIFCNVSVEPSVFFLVFLFISQTVPRVILQVKLRFAKLARHTFNKLPRGLALFIWGNINKFFFFFWFDWRKYSRH